MLKCREKCDLANLREGDFILVAGNIFYQGEKLCLRWRGTRLVRKVMNKCSLQLEDLGNMYMSVVHGTRLNFYHYPSLKTTAIMSNVISPWT